MVTGKERNESQRVKALDVAKYMVNHSRKELKEEAQEVLNDLTTLIERMSDIVKDHPEIVVIAGIGGIVRINVCGQLAISAQIGNSRGITVALKDVINAKI